MSITLKKHEAEGVLNTVKNAKHYTGERRLLNSPVEYARDFVRINASFDQVTRELVACNINPYQMSKVICEFMGLMATEINGLEGVRK